MNVLDSARHAARRCPSSARHAMRSTRRAHISAPGAVPAFPLRPDNLTAPEAERRQLSVMLCDLVGSTPLSGRLDPEELAEVIRIYQTRVAGVIARFGGYIARYVGDGILSYFGWPESKEADAERAVRAGLAVVSARGNADQGRDDCKFVSASPPAPSWSASPSGPAMRAIRRRSVRRRILPLGFRRSHEPDSVVIDDATRQADRRSVHVSRSRQSWLLKGFPMPRAGRGGVLEERTVGDRFAALHAARLVPLVDREEELALLLQPLAACERREGPVGIARGRAGHRQVPSGRGIEGTSARRAHTPTCVISARRITRQVRFIRSSHVWSTRRASPAATVRRTSSANLKLCFCRQGPSTEDIVLIADLLGIPANELFQKLNLSPQRKKQKTFEALTRRVIALARQRPLLLLAEDVHWADPSSLELLDRMIGLLSDLPVLLIVSFRPEFSPPWVEYAHCDRRHVEPSQPPRCRAAGDGGHDRARACHRRCSIGSSPRVTAYPCSSRN